jgi:alkylhydroperoxidase family enzyme
MHLPLLPPTELDADRRALYDDMLAGIEAKLKGFVSKTADGALVGPFNPMLHFPQFGAPAWAFTKALGADSVLPKPAREIAILVVGAKLHARYEIYAHTHVARSVGLAETTIATILAGHRPVDLTADEAAAYDVASALCAGGAVAEATYRVAVAAFGPTGYAELAFLVGGYLQISALLNAYDVPVPDDETPPEPHATP